MQKEHFKQLQSTRMVSHVDHLHSLNHFCGLTYACILGKAYMKESGMIKLFIEPLMIYLCIMCKYTRFSAELWVTGELWLVRTDCERLEGLE